MAIDKRGVFRGAFSNMVYRSYREQQIIQLKPVKVKQTLSSQEAALEFGLAGSTACIIRKAFGYVYAGYDGKMVNRFNLAVQKSIAGSNKGRGERCIHDGDLSLLKGFQFNAASAVDKVIQQRPTVSLTSSNQISIKMPAVKMKDIKGPTCSEYIIRFVAISFDFHKEVYSYNGYREIKIDHKHSFEGGKLVFEEAAIPGRMLLISMSVHGFESDGFGGRQCFNSKAWSPAEIIEGLHIPARSEEPPIQPDDILMPYSGNEALRKIIKLRAKRVNFKPPLWQPPPKSIAEELNYLKEIFPPERYLLSRILNMQG